MRKKRVLFCSEATYLNTGYATYAREVLSRLHASGKYEIAEFASYGKDGDPRNNFRGDPYLYWNWNSHWNTDVSL